jgi:multicomponent Na+:H+ antiporter subunit B
MNSIILQIAAKHIKWIFILFAIIALLRGHNYPGGGFIAGLLASLAIIFYGFAYTFKKLKEKLSSKPEYFISSGLATIIISFLPSILHKEELMKGMWLKIELPLIGLLKLGTPFLFDIGIFLAVIGVTLLFMTSLTKETLSEGY